jgi:proline iminopeptidase
MMKTKVIYWAISLLVLLFAACKDDRDINTPGNLVPKTVDLDPSLPSISISGTQLHAEAFGNPNDAMVLMLHGGPGGDYRSLLNAKQLVNNGYYVVFYDQRGSGLSKRHSKSSYSIQIMIDDVKEVIAHYRTSPNQKVFLFGHSWGAILAAAYVNSYPNSVDGVVFAEPGGFTWNNLKEYGERSRKIKLFAENTNNVLYIDQFLTGKENDHAILDYKLNISSSFIFEKDNVEGINGLTPFWRNGAVVLNSLAAIAEKDGYDFTPNLHKYNTKVLFLYGSKNKAYGFDFAKKEAQNFPNYDIVKIENTGHEMIYFEWNQVYAATLTYFNLLK